MTNTTLRSTSFLAVWLVGSCLVSAQDAATVSAARQLAVGESIRVDVVSKEKFNRTGLNVAAGEHYSFVVTDGAKWKDLTIVCDANGWLSKEGAAPFRKFLEKSEKNRRVPAANWFELVGTIDENEANHFQIGLRGKEWTLTVKTDGELFLFANDLLKMYGNNHDSIDVTVTRESAPGKHSLPVNPAKP